MEVNTTLIEHSQVLKGESVPHSHAFGGLPAKLLQRRGQASTTTRPRAASSNDVAGRAANVQGRKDVSF